MRMCRPVVLALLLLAGVGPLATTALAESFCYVTEVKHEAVSNAIQVTVKADGILKWEWAGGGDWYAENRRQLIGVRFTNARMKLDENFFDVDETPVSTIVLSVPQDAKDGTGVVMELQLSERSGFKGISSTDERSFVLTVDAPLRAEGGGKAAGGASGKGEEEFLSVEISEGLVSVRALRADIHNVIAEIGRQTGLNVTLDGAVTHKVNINLNDKEPLELIRAIATGYGLALSTKGDVYMLSEGVPRDLTTYNRSGTTSFPMRYLRAEDAKELLPTFLTKYVHFNPEQNAVVATAPLQMLDKIQRDLKSVDLPPPLIMIEVLAVELTNTDAYEREIAAMYNTHDMRLGSDSGSGDMFYQDTVTGGLTGGVIANTARLTGVLQALQTTGSARIRSNPRIAALNGKRAVIFIGQDRFILVQYESGGYLQERIETVPVGVRLTANPWTGGNGEITTRVNIDVSNISEIDPSTGLPLLSTRKASSTVRTRDGETIVIGGLRQNQREVTRRRIPILGDLPIIGSLFQSKSVSNVVSELVIFITPRILSLDGELLDESQAELRGRLLEPGDCGFDPEACLPVERPGSQEQGDISGSARLDSEAISIDTPPDLEEHHPTPLGQAWSIGRNRASR